MNRTELVERIFAPYREKRVLVIGIGGGGDVVGTLPTCFDLERIGAEVIPAGLTWKRVVHDPYGRPRPIDHFERVEKINSLVAMANPQTRVTSSNGENIVHSEANVSRALGGRPIAMIDITPGSAALREALLHFQRACAVDAIIGIDAGGDVLCFGDEPTLASPICDQTVLQAIAPMPGSLLGVFGFGSDGEMPLSSLRPRFATLQKAGAYRGLLPICSDDMATMRRVLQEAPTEASRLPIEIAETVSDDRLDRIATVMNLDAPDLEEAVGNEREISMRSGCRVATLSDLSATTFYMDPKAVLSSSGLSTLWNDRHSIDEMSKVFAQSGITTEFSDRERKLFIRQ